MKQIKKLSTHTAVYLFRRSFTYKCWRLYCRFRDSSITLIKEGKIRKQKYFAQEMNRLIIKSKTFTRWIKYYYLSQSISNFIYSKILIKLIKILKLIIPNSVKRFIKKNILLYFLSPNSQVSARIKHEWRVSSYVRDDASADIFIFGITGWDYRFQRPQHLALGLADLGHRIFYVESEFSSDNARISVAKIQNNVYKIKLYSAKNYFIYSDQPAKQDIARMLESLEVIMRESRSINVVVKVDHPFWTPLVERLNVPIIYDCMDEHTGFKETGHSAESLENKLFSSADLVLASSDRLFKKVSKAKPKGTLMLKNAGEYLHFKKASEPQLLKAPKDIKDLRTPILGYYGAVADWLDSNIIKQLAISFPEVSIVIIGRIQSDQITALAKQYSNIHCLGEKPYSQLPQYLAAFDVCLIPFKINRLIKATNPVKIYEYFASGKPVVATNIPELMEYGDLVYLADNSQSFVQSVKKALGEHSSAKRLARQQVAKANTWQTRSTKLNDELMKLAYPLVSIIVVVYNNPVYTKITIDSILQRSKYPNYELILVDNHSSAVTKNVLKTYVKSKRVKVINCSSNLGFAGGNNVGLRSAKGDYLILLNNDVRVTPGWISRLVNHAKIPGVGLVGPVTNNIGNEAKINIVYNPENISQLETEAANYTYSHWNQTMPLHKLAAFCWIQTRSTLKDIGYLDEVYGPGLFEDDDYCVRVNKSGRKILLAEDVFIHHYGGKTTKWNSLKYRKLFLHNKKIFEAKWGIKWEENKYHKGVR